MAYVVFHRFGEVDPAKAHAKLTHERLGALPIPSVDWSSREQVGVHRIVSRHAEALVAGVAKLGGPEDRALEVALRSLLGVSPEQWVHINRELMSLPPSQVIRDLFPDHVGRGGSLGVVAVDEDIE